MPRGVLTEEQRARMLAVMRSPAYRDKIAAAGRGRSPSQATRRKLSEALRGRLFSEETRQKMRSSKLGRKQAPEHAARRAATAIGRPLSAEHRRKLSLANVERNSVVALHSPAARKKAADALRGRRRDPLLVVRTAASQRGQKRASMSPDQLELHRQRMAKPEVRAKMSAAAIDRLGRPERFRKTKIERFAERLLAPFGFSYQGRAVERHRFDFAAGSRVIEVNGCYWHDHRAVEMCGGPERIFAGATEKDRRVRGLAAAHGLQLLELWECQRLQWPEQVSQFMEVGRG